MNLTRPLFAVSGYKELAVYGYRLRVGTDGGRRIGGRNGAEAGRGIGGGMEAIIQINHEKVRRREARFAAAGPRRWHIAAARNIRVRCATSPRARE